jgi:CBS domain-containing protein
MNARDIMTAHVVTVTPTTTVRELAGLLATRRISAVPVVGSKGELVGVVSEGDLVRRRELQTARTRSWWLDLFVSEQGLAQDFIKTHAVKVADIMTRDVITVGPEASLSEVARLLEKHAIKRVPVVSNRQLIGIISRANLVQALASLEAKPHLQLSPSDAEIRSRIVRRLENEPWAHTSLLNVLVNDGIVDLWGIVQTSVEKNAVRIAAEATEGVRAVNDNLVLRPIESMT